MRLAAVWLAAQEVTDMKDVDWSRRAAVLCFLIAALALLGCGTDSGAMNGAAAPGVRPSVAPPVVQNPQLNPGAAPTMPAVPTTQPMMVPMNPIGAAGAASAPPAMPPGATSMQPPNPMMMAAPPSLYDAATKKLAAPAAGEGAQITTKQFDLGPGQELFACYHTSIPIDGEINVSYFESIMAEGSHHFILFKNDGDTTPDGTLVPSACTLGFDQRWVYSSAVPHFQTNMPKGVAVAMAPRQQVVFDMHYFNVSDKMLHAFVTLNVNLAKGEFQKAASLVSFNTGIFLPPGGKQTVGGDCTPGAGAKFFIMLTHTHRRGVLSSVHRVLANGMMGEELVRTDDWEHPPTMLWDEPDFLTFGAGEKFHYECQYQNDLDQIVTVGNSADVNEMCMAISYFFPASAAGSCN
jgi:hypothetical protein